MRKEFFLGKEWIFFMEIKNPAWQKGIKSAAFAAKLIIDGAVQVSDE